MPGKGTVYLSNGINYRPNSDDFIRWFCTNSAHKHIKKGDHKAIVGTQSFTGGCRINKNISIFDGLCIDCIHLLPYVLKKDFSGSWGNLFIVGGRRDHEYVSILKYIKFICPSIEVSRALSKFLT